MVKTEAECFLITTLINPFYMSPAFYIDFFKVPD